MILDNLDHIANRLGLIPPQIKINEVMKTKKIIPTDIFPYVMDTNGVLYDIQSHALIDVVNTQKRFRDNDLRKTDIVFDIGSHIGEIALRVCDKVMWVHAFEPITYDQVVRNVDLNKRLNITVHPFGIGRETTETEMKYFSKSKPVCLRPLKHFYTLYGCTFLSSNCEGGEWEFPIDILKNIRRIEIEFHMFTKNKRPELIEEIKEYFDVEIDKNKWVLEVHGVNHNV